MKIFKKIIFWCLVAFALIQFIPIDKVNKPVNRATNFVEVKKTPSQVTALLKRACYDCHSDETVYPKYASFAPISWSIKDHVNEGKRRFNLSIWTTYDAYLKESIVDGTIQALKNKTMPLPGYLVYHDEAKLTDKERALLLSYFEEMQKAKSY